ncbi:MAG: hypothetical protein LBJ14_10180 [Desulfarculales bacterium]|jgi:mannose-6-phosphate isomerase-like protein (cupin superfamily)|nr:hypothetical protein [Desulfarculales bacterium]
MMEKITYGDSILAIILRASFRGQGIQFLTPDTFSQQLGYMRHPVGHVIAPHTHRPVVRQIELTQEVLFIRSGRVRLDIYTPEREYLQSRILESGDVVLLAHGGHGLVILEEAEIIEVKQGPYAGEADKARFAPVEEALITCCSQE